MDSEDEVVDTFSFAVTYSTDFNDVGMSLSAGYAAGSYQHKKHAGTSADASALVDELAIDANILRVGGEADGQIRDDLSVVGTGESSVAAAGLGGLPGSNKGQDPASLGMGVGFTFGDFGFNGTWGQQDVTDGGEITVFALGGTYNMDAFTFGLAWANQETQRAGYLLNAESGTASYQAAGGALYESDTVAFTVNYQVGEGANVGFVLETNDYTRTGTTSTGSGASTVYSRTAVEDSRTGFGVGVNLSF